MSPVPHFTEEQIAELCDLETVTDWLERAWRDLGAGEAATTSEGEGRGRRPDG